MFSTWIGVVLLFVVFGLFVWRRASARCPRGDTYEEKRAKARMEKLEQLHKESTAALTSYAWVDKKKGTVRIPIERAMELTMADLASKKPAAGGSDCDARACSGRCASRRTRAFRAAERSTANRPRTPRRSRFLSKVRNRKFAASRRRGESRLRSAGDTARRIGHTGRFAAVRRSATKSSRQTVPTPVQSPRRNSVAGPRQNSDAMSIADLINRMKRYEKNAEMIFDAEEPIGTPTDLVMPRRRWFRTQTGARFIGSKSFGSIEMETVTDDNRERGGLRAPDQSRRAKLRTWSAR